MGARGNTCWICTCCKELEHYGTVDADASYSRRTNISPWDPCMFETGER
jgi:hypothetical protein